MGSQLGLFDLSIRDLLFARFDVTSAAPIDLLAAFAGAAGEYDHSELRGHDSPVVGFKILNEGENAIYIARTEAEAVVAGARTDTIRPRLATDPPGSGGVWTGAIGLRWLVRPGWAGATADPGLWAIADGADSEITFTALLY